MESHSLIPYPPSFRVFDLFSCLCRSLEWQRGPPVGGPVVHENVGVEVAVKRLGAAVQQTRTLVEPVVTTTTRIARSLYT